MDTVKRIVSLLLTAAILITSSPVSAFATAADFPVSSDPDAVYEQTADEENPPLTEQTAEPSADTEQNSAPPAAEEEESDTADETPAGQPQATPAPSPSADVTDITGTDKETVKEDLSATGENKADSAHNNAAGTKSVWGDFSYTILVRRVLSNNERRTIVVLVTI